MKPYCCTEFGLALKSVENGLCSSAGRWFPRNFPKGC